MQITYPVLGFSGLTTRVFRPATWGLWLAALQAGATTAVALEGF